MGGKSAPPPPPDYAAAAQQTAQGNLANAIVSQTGNMVNQKTPQGQVTYTPTVMGYTDASGKFLTDQQYKALDQAGQGGYVPVNQWTQNVTLSPEQQAMYDQNQQINKNLGGIAQQGLGYVQNALNKPLSFADAQAIQTPGQIQQQASDAAYKNATQYLDPQFQRQGASMENQLANQGITRGSEAWNNAMQDFNNTKQQAYSSAQNQAYLQGLQGANQSYNQAMGNRQQQITEAQTLQQNPLNMLNAVRSGQQMQVTNQPNVGVSNPGQMANVAGADMLGATNAQYNGMLSGWNAQEANKTNRINGLLQAGATAAMASDVRMKKDIVKIGNLNNGLNLYKFRYKPEFNLGDDEHIGVMAQEVKETIPDAVITNPDGYMMVNYGVIYA